MCFRLFFFNDTATTEIYTLSLHDALPISVYHFKIFVTYGKKITVFVENQKVLEVIDRSEEHTSELQSPDHLVCRLLLEKKKEANTSPCLESRVTPALRKQRSVSTLRTVTI